MTSNKMGSVELLAPAGQLKSVYGAINAGADAVYLGAPVFSARAYADNLSIEEIIEALDFAHIMGRKIYLALNILLKEQEISEAIELVSKLYVAGLDGIIVQDIGLASIIRQKFPDMELHGSTQMAVTSYNAVSYLKDNGFCRIVPARELSLNEIKKITDTGIDVECFIHGAMCYSYSGKCLFSSIAGGRSGNRGRCAGTCRKMYDTYIDGRKVNTDNCRYPLSMRDMCSVMYIPDLIDAGVKSFKIEGRMKAPEYTAGVTAVYRRVIDDYVNYGKRPDVKKCLSELSRLYMRSETSTGYLHLHNGPEMISFSSPSYKGIDDNEIKEIDRKYLDNNISRAIDIYCRCVSGSEIQLTANCQEFSASVTGAVPEIAKNAGTDEKTFIKQLSKTGGTYFNCNNVYVETDGKCFVPVSVLNGLRRQLLDGLTEEMLKPYKKTMADTVFESELKPVSEADSDMDNNKDDNKDDSTDDNLSSNFLVSVNSMKQLSVLVHYPIVKNVLVSFELAKELAKYKAKYKAKEQICYKDSRDISGSVDSKIEDLRAEYSVVDNCESDSFRKDINEILGFINCEEVKMYFGLPQIIRDTNSKKSISSEMDFIIESGIFAGIYAGSIDALSIAKERFSLQQIHGDTGLYVFNNFSAQSLLKDVSTYTASYEHSRKELNGYVDRKCREIIIYGYIPLMYSAGCVLKNLTKCNPASESKVYIADEKGRRFPVVANHSQCFNIIYNYLPLRLFDDLADMLYYNDAKTFRIDFTVEGKKEVADIIEQLISTVENINDKGTVNAGVDKNKYTAGHYRRGVL